MLGDLTTKRIGDLAFKAVDPSPLQTLCPFINPAACFQRVCGDNAGGEQS
jgi:hypothetical protein